MCGDSGTYVFVVYGLNHCVLVSGLINDDVLNVSAKFYRHEGVVRSICSVVCFGYFFVLIRRDFLEIALLTCLVHGISSQPLSFAHRLTKRHCAGKNTLVSQHLFCRNTRVHLGGQLSRASGFLAYHCDYRPDENRCDDIRISWLHYSGCSLFEAAAHSATHPVSRSRWTPAAATLSYRGGNSPRSPRGRTVRHPSCSTRITV